MSSALGVIGIILYAMVGFLYVASGLVVPYPAVFGMWGIWMAGWVALARVFDRRRAWTPVVAVTALGVWVVIVQLGDRLLGWTA